MACVLRLAYLYCLLRAEWHLWYHKRWLKDTLFPLKCRAWNAVVRFHNQDKRRLIVHERGPMVGHQYAAWPRDNPDDDQSLYDDTIGPRYDGKTGRRLTKAETDADTARRRQKASQS